MLLHSLRGCRTLTSLSLEGNGYVRRDTQSSLQRFHEQSSASLDRPSAIEVAAANAFGLILGGSAATQQGESEAQQQKQVLHKCQSLSDVRTSSKPLPLRELCLKSDSSMIFGPHVITAAVAALAFNNILQVLDVSGNECGDALARQLETVLRVNRSLQVLFWDDNFTTVDGFFRFYDGLVHNQTLVMVQMPIRDTRRVSIVLIYAGVPKPRTVVFLTNALGACSCRSWRNRKTRLATSSLASWARSSR